jgi:hypothetical protein
MRVSNPARPEMKPAIVGAAVSGFAQPAGYNYGQHFVCHAVFSAQTSTIGIEP